MLYFTATPIGNLEDITYRAIRIMKETDYIICEDTRKTVILLNKYRIKKPMKPYNDYNKKKQAEWIIEQLKKGMDIVFVSSSGSPLISDPGFYLVKRLIQEGLPFTSLPGPSAVINSLILSGLPPDRFVFEGFLPKKKGKRHKLLKDLSCEKRTVIIYESPKRIKRLINELEEFLPDREISIVKEMTKIHQRVLIGKPKELMENLHSEKGEFVVIIGGKDWTGIE
ncbi:MAG: 16S rRNA (cytidine(1402)-2'-O)-methyltransferase [Candidatus Stahlbacteria bacterium]|nr:MAG: 16S rRNA (cytidine(1402)-2'-O)-methyltransferase [Candidatus Stahlbacteria bacterium]